MSKIQLINFVKQIDTNCDKTNTIGDQLDGNEIKEFYENVISTEDPVNEKIKSDLNRFNPKTVVKKIQTKSKTNQNSLKSESIFSICQNGDLEECQQWLRMGFNVNTRDQYLWTPLMCSSCAGHHTIVKLLLKNSADIDAKDKSGRTASDLALINGHKHVFQLISEHKNSKYKLKSKKKQKTNEKSDETVDNFLKKCSICDKEYNGCDIRHNCSIVHQISVKNDRKFNKYFKISETNKGFQMLLRNGWTRDRGLGPDGSGMTAPIKTVLKMDRKGLGLVHNKPKVTHFEAFDTTSVKQNRTTKLDRRIQTENRLKRLEIKFRNEFK